MAIYKGVEIDDELITLVRHMRDVEDYREALGRLQSGWDTLTLMGQLTGAAAEMSGTREAFERLTGDLLNNLGREIRRKVVGDLAARARNGIDVLVRNLFERTADIGFLAADTEIAAFLEGGCNPDQRSAIEARFREYVAKYSVYSDVILLDRDNRVRARLQPQGAEATRDPFCAGAMTTSAAYVEHYGEWDLLPPGRHLVYAHRVCDSRGGARGVLALVFRLNDEMTGVYEKLANEDDSTVLAIVSPQGEVVATSSPLQLPVGQRLPRAALKARGDVVRFAGRVYLAVATAATPYQGYAAPGWLGVAITPADSAFEGRDHALLSNLNPVLLEELMHGSTVFKEQLRAIPRRAAAIQADLNRSVWNGSVRQPDRQDTNAAFSKTLLWEISNVGRKTQDVFEQSIVNLHETVVAEVLQDALSRAAFAVDVMDRNLYERANDCRWWALTDVFRRALAEAVGGGLDTCGRVLASINALYTVYSTLLLFDSAGRVVAASNAAGQHFVGTRLSEPWVGAALGLRTTQEYAVSAFAPTPLYGDAPTYVFGAAVRAPGSSRPVGGIGVVFDSTPQFAAMLQDAVPAAADGSPMEGAFALFVRRNGTVLASSTERFKAGHASGFEGLASGLANGGTSCQVLSLGDQYYAVAAVMSAGYREYKVTDGRRDDVVAVCAAPIGRATQGQARPRRAATARGHVRALGSNGVSLATFHVGRHWFGVPADAVIEAVDCAGFTPRPRAGSSAMVGYKRYKNELVPLVRLDRLMGLGAGEGAQTQAVLLKTEQGPPIGLLVDALGDVPEIAAGDMLSLQDHEALRNGFARHVVPGLVREDGGTGMLTLLDTGRILQMFAGRHEEDARLSA